MSRHIIVFIALYLIIPVPTFATSSVSNVGSPAVDAGKSTFEVRAGYRSGQEHDQQLEFTQIMDHAMNDSYALRISATQSQLRQDNLEHTSITIEQRLQLIEARDYGWSGGIRLAYAQRDGDKSPNKLSMRALASVPIYDWQWTHNTIFSHDIGPDSDTGFAVELRNRLAYKVPHSSEQLRVGFELFNDFGKINSNQTSENDHQFGPFMKFSLSNNVSFQMVYRSGLSNSSQDHSAYSGISYSF